MDGKTWQILKKYEAEQKPLFVKIVNSYGEKGFVQGMISPYIKGDRRHYGFYLEVKTKGKNTITLDLIEDYNYQSNLFNTFRILEVMDADSHATIFKNEEAEKAMAVNYRNFDIKHKSLKQWKSKEPIKFLLQNIGQYIEVIEKEDKYAGVLKSVYYDKETGKTLINLIETSHHARLQRLDNDCKFKSYPNVPGDHSSVCSYKVPRTGEEVFELK